MQKFINAGTTGAVAGIAVLGSSYFLLPAWVLFLAWLGYFFSGASIKSGMKMLASMIAGVAIACAIVTANTQLEPLIGFIALPAIVGLVAGSMTLLEDQSPFDAIPAYYLGMATFIASGAPPTLSTLVTLTVAATLGVLCGWAAVELRKFGPANSSALDTKVAPNSQSKSMSR